MKNPNYETLLARITNATLRDAAAKCFEAADKFATTRDALKSNQNLTDAGRALALRESLPGYARELGVAAKSILKMAADAKTRRNALRVSVDKTDVVAAGDRREIREFLRSLDPLERATLLTGTNDERILEAALTAPPELVGLTGNQRALAEAIETRFLAMTQSGELGAVEMIEAAVGEAESALAVARGEMRSIAALDARTFESVAGPAALAGSAPWLVKGGANGPMVVEVGDDGHATYRAATPWEIANGEYRAPTESDAE